MNKFCPPNRSDDLSFILLLCLKVIPGFYSSGLVGLLPKEEMRARIKARLLEDGPRQKQKSVLAVLWAGETTSYRKTMKITMLGTRQHCRNNVNMF